MYYPSVPETNLPPDPSMSGLDSQLTESFDPAPPLHLLLAGNRIGNVPVFLQVYKPVQLVSLCEALELPGLVLPNPCSQVARHAGVNGLGSITHHVHVIRFLQ